MDAADVVDTIPLEQDGNVNSTPRKQISSFDTEKRSSPFYHGGFNGLNNGLTENKWHDLGFQNTCTFYEILWIHRNARKNWMTYKQYAHESPAGPQADYILGVKAITKLKL